MDENSPMTEDRAREILRGYFDPDEGLRTTLHDGGVETVHVIGDYTADQLEAIAWWMRNKGLSDGVR